MANRSKYYWYNVLHRAYIQLHNCKSMIDNTHISPTIVTSLHCTYYTSLPIFHFPALSDVSSPRFKNPSFTITLFLKICGLEGKVVNASAGSWFHSSLTCLQSSIYRYLNKSPCYVFRPFPVVFSQVAHEMQLQRCLVIPGCLKSKTRVWMSLMLTTAALLIPDSVSLLCWIGTDLRQVTAVFLVSCHGPVREHPNMWDKLLLTLTSTHGTQGC